MDYHFTKGKFTEAELEKAIIELCQQNVHLALENGALKLELQKLKGENENGNYKD